jgi:exonuclease III
MDDLASSTTQPFEVLWLNINGINSNNSDCNVSLLIRSFLRSNYSILFLQEPRLKEAKANDIEKAFNWPNSKVQGFSTSNEAGNGGVATVVKKDFLQTVANFLVVELAKDECQHATFSVGLTQFSFANLHLNSRSGSKRGRTGMYHIERHPASWHHYRG